MDKRNKGKKDNNPYDVLSQVIARTKSPILLFIIGYGVIIVLLAAFGKSLVSEINVLLIILPLVGVLGYLVNEILKILQKQKNQQHDKASDRKVINPSDPGKPNLPKLEYYSDLYYLLENRLNMDEIKGLCFDIGVDYESISGNNKSAILRELITFLKRRNKVEELENWIQMHRSDIATDLPNK